jgi:hypothetical protein
MRANRRVPRWYNAVVMKSIPSRKAQRRTVAAYGPVCQIIARIPRPYPPSQEHLGALITKELLDILATTISDAEQDSPVILEKLDTLILKQAETMGWRLGLSALVHQRFNAWDLKPDGPQLFERYGKALARSARCFQRLELPPIDDPDLYPFKNETVTELRILLRSLRNAFRTKRRGPTSDELIDCFRKTVSEGGDAFIHLKTNIGSWVKYLKAYSTTIRPPLLGKRAAPASLFDSWFAWCKGLEPETVRQTISELGKFVSSSQ